MAEARYGVGILGWGGAARTFHAPFIPLVPGLELRGGDESALRSAETSAVIPMGVTQLPPG